MKGRGISQVIFSQTPNVIDMKLDSQGLSCEKCFGHVIKPWDFIIFTDVITLWRMFGLPYKVLDTFRNAIPKQKQIF